MYHNKKFSSVPNAWELFLIVWTALCFVLLATQVRGQSYPPVKVGSSPNNEDGDTPKVAMEKLNNGFLSLQSVSQRSFDLVRDFHALMDGEQYTNIAIAAGTNYLRITGTGQRFGKGFNLKMIGQPILIYGAGIIQTAAGKTTTNCLSTGISNVIDATSVLLSNVAFTPVNFGQQNAMAVSGSDDTAAVQAWFNSSSNFINGTDGVLTAPDGICVIAGPIIDPQPTPITTAYNNHKNSQVIFPDFPHRGEWTRTVKIKGLYPITEHEIVNSPGSLGTIFWSFYVNTNFMPFYQNAAANPLLQLCYVPSVFSFQNWGNSQVFTVSAQDGMTNNFNGVRVEMENINVRTAANPNINAVDLRGATSAFFHHGTINTGLRMSNDYKPVFTNACGILMPMTFCDPGGMIDDIEVNSFWNGVALGEHITCRRGIIQGCENATFLWGGGHGCTFENWDPEGNHNLFYNYGGSFCIYGFVTCEGENNSGQWWFPQTVIRDWNNAAHGELAVQDTGTTAWNVAGAMTNHLSGEAANIVIHRMSHMTDGTADYKTYVANREEFGDVHWFGNIFATNSGTEIRALSVDFPPGGAIRFANSLLGLGFSAINYNSSSGDVFLNSGGGWVRIGDPNSGIGNTRGAAFAKGGYFMTNTPSQWPTTVSDPGGGVIVLSNNGTAYPSVYWLSTHGDSTTISRTNLIVFP